MERNAPKKINPEIIELKNRVSEVKNALPKGYLTLFFQEYPEYDTYAASILVRNVISLRSCDTTITEKLEQLAKKLQKVSV